MRIPNKFNGYSRDGRRLYNDPATVTVTLATMGETAAISSAASAAAAAATAAAGAQALGTGAGAMGSMTGGMELAGLTNAATPAMFNPATIGGLAESLGASQYLGQGLAGLDAGAMAPQFGMSAPELFNPATAASATDPLQLAQADAVPTIESSIKAADAAATGKTTVADQISKVKDDFVKLLDKPNWANIKQFANENPKTSMALGALALRQMQPKPPKMQETPGTIRPYKNTQQVNPNVAAYQPYSGGSTAERNWFTGGLEALPTYRAAAGGLTALAVGGPVERMAAENAIGANLDYPQANLQTAMYSNPMVQRPVAANVINQGIDTNVSPYSGEERGFAAGGMFDLGGYSDGGRLLRGPGDGVSDSIPASIGDRRPARLADGEFVVPARIVSELGNGSTEAGARKLYAMMDRVQNARKKSIGKKKVAVDSKAEKLLPA